MICPFTISATETGVSDDHLGKFTNILFVFVIAIPVHWFLLSATIDNFGSIGLPVFILAKTCSVKRANRISAITIFSVFIRIILKYKDGRFWGFYCSERQTLKNLIYFFSNVDLVNVFSMFVFPKLIIFGLCIRISIFPLEVV